MFDVGANALQQRNLGCCNTGTGINCDGILALFGGREPHDTFVECEGKRTLGVAEPTILASLAKVGVIKLG